MASTLHESMFEEAVARGEARGARRRCAEIVIRILGRRVGALDPSVATRIRAEPSIDTLDIWENEALDALYASDVECARRLIEKINHAPLS